MRLFVLLYTKYIVTIPLHILPLPWHVIAVSLEELGMTKCFITYGSFDRGPKRWLSTLYVSVSDLYTDPSTHSSLSLDREIFYIFAIIMKSHIDL